MQASIGNQKLLPDLDKTPPPPWKKGEHRRVNEKGGQFLKKKKGDLSRGEKL